MIRHSPSPARDAHRPAATCVRCGTPVHNGYARTDGSVSHAVGACPRTYRGGPLPRVGDPVSCIQIGHYGEHPATAHCLLIGDDGRSIGGALPAD